MNTERAVMERDTEDQQAGVIQAIFRAMERRMRSRADGDERLSEQRVPVEQGSRGVDSGAR